MPSPQAPPGPPAWSVAVHLRHRGGLEIRAAAENVLPGWGRGGERLSLLLRLRRRLLLAVTSQCGPRSPLPAKPGEGRIRCKILRFLRTRWARVPRLASFWRRKKPPPEGVAAAIARPGRRRQQSRAPTGLIQSFRAMAWTPTSATTLRFVAAFVVVAVAMFAVFRITGGVSNRRGSCDCDGEPAARWVKFWELMEHAPLNNRKNKWLLGLLKRALQWFLSK